ncbi:MAG: signal peptide peptidase SppA [Chthoniobacterales bacterium]|nr:signal peptide peptidase SppA [Chthoniobacterales bacterium]
MATNNRLGCLTIFLFVALCASIVINMMLGLAAVSRFGGPTRLNEPMPRFREVVVERGGRTTGPKIALISLRGVISTARQGNVGESMVDDMRYALDQAQEDDDVRAIVLEIDSPGGEVTASDAIYHAVVRARAKKPVVVYMNSLAASGGYYVACGGQFLMANDTTITGSIGVIIQTLNYEELLGKVGLAAITFKSGEFKDMLSGSRPITEEERQYVQGFVMGTYEKFLGIVATERNLSAETLRNTVADGRILSGRDAQEHKLIDGLGQIEDAYRKAKELGNAPTATVVKYGPPFTLGRFFRALSQSDRTIEVTLPKQLLPQLESGRAYYLPSYYAP